MTFINFPYVFVLCFMQQSTLYKLCPLVEATCIKITCDSHVKPNYRFRVLKVLSRDFSSENFSAEEFSFSASEINRKTEGSFVIDTFVSPKMTIGDSSFFFLSPQSKKGACQIADYSIYRILLPNPGMVIHPVRSTEFNKDFENRYPEKAETLGLVKAISDYQSLDNIERKKLVASSLKSKNAFIRDWALYIK